MSNREFTATRTMLANAFATAGAELLDYMGTAAALAAIPNTDPPRYVVAGTLAMIAKVLPSADAPAAATVLTDERIEQVWDEVPLTGAFTMVEARRKFARAIEREVLAHAGVTAEPAEPFPEHWRSRAEWIATTKELGQEERGRIAVMLLRTIVAAPAQVPAAEVRAQALRFADDVISNAFDGGDLDGGTVQEMAEACGLITPRTMTEPCGPVCNCMEAGAEFPTTCYRKTYLRSLAQQSTADKASEVRAAEDAEYELHQDDMMVAATSGKNAYAEIQHYANQYVQDGPVEIFKVVRTAIERHAIPRSRTADSANTGALGEKGAE